MFGGNNNNNLTASSGNPTDGYAEGPAIQHATFPPHANDGKTVTFDEATNSPPHDTGSPSDISPGSSRRGSAASDMFGEGNAGVDEHGRPLPVPLSHRERRMSKEWDASQTPPSRFQKLQGSIMATPASRDGHVPRNKIHGFKEKVKHLAHK